MGKFIKFDDHMFQMGWFNHHRRIPWFGFASNFHGSKKRVSQNSFLEVPATEVRSLTNARLEYKTNVETKVWSLVDFAWMSLGARWWKLQKTGTEFSPQKWRLLLFRIWGICYLCLTSERNDLELFFWRFVPVWSHTQADTVRSRVTKTYCRSLFFKELLPKLRKTSLPKTVQFFWNKSRQTRRLYRNDHLRNQVPCYFQDVYVGKWVFPSNPWTLQWKGLNLLKIVIFEGSGFLGLDIPC